MPNYFYTDANGNKQGPFTAEQLQTMAKRGIITPDTLLETDTGHKGTASQIPGLNFNTAEPSPSTQASQAAPSMQDKIHTARATAKQAASEAGDWAKKEGLRAVRTWLLDFAFRDLRLPVINLWLSRIVYAICCFVAVIALATATLVMPFLSLRFIFVYREFGEAFIGLFIGLPLFWLGTLLVIALIRISLELYVILFDWIIETTKAARKYNENRP